MVGFQLSDVIVDDAAEALAVNRKKIAVQENVNLVARVEVKGQAVKVETTFQEKFTA